MTGDQELEEFKRNINLRDFVESMGYAVDYDDSWSVKRPDGSFVMRKGTSDKIIVRHNPEPGHWVYYSTRDDSDNGTIVDFLRRRTADNLGQMRKRLRT